MGLFDSMFKTTILSSRNPMDSILKNDGPSLIDKLDMLLTDVETEGKKQGYDKAAREYSVAFDAIESEYKSAREMIDNQKKENDEKSELLIQKYEELVRTREELQSKVSSKTNEVSQKYNTSPGVILQAIAGGNVFAPTPQIDILGLIYSHKEKKLREAERQGYAEAEELYEKKIFSLQRELDVLKEKGNAEIRRLVSLTADVLSAISDEQMKIAALRIML